MDVVCQRSPNVLHVLKDATRKHALSVETNSANSATKFWDPAYVILGYPRPPVPKLVINDSLMLTTINATCIMRVTG